jgi:hypothetical protein
MRLSLAFIGAGPVQFDTKLKCLIILAEYVNDRSLQWFYPSAASGLILINDFIAHNKD